VVATFFAHTFILKSNRKEKRFKLQEAELREKDVLIQENLIRFSTFLQQQNMRKNKDKDHTDNEL